VWLITIPLGAACCTSCPSSIISKSGYELGTLT
jgi:hypothetical protein